MKRIVALLMLFVTLLTFVSCSAEQEEVSVPDGFLQAEKNGADYEFFYPDTWILERNDAGVKSVYVSENDFSNVNVTAFTASYEYADLASYAKEYYFEQFESNFKNLSIEKNQDGSIKGSALKIDGCPAYAVNYSAEFGGETYSFRVWFISCDGYIYTVLYTAKEALFEEHLTLASKTAEFIRFN